MKRLYAFGSLGVVLLLSSAVASISLAAQGDPVAGKATYEKTCAMCHGPTGKGDGPTAAVLNPKPRNHTDGNYMNAPKTTISLKLSKRAGKALANHN